MPINILAVSVTGCAHTYYLSRVSFGGHYRTKNSVSIKRYVYWHQNASIPADYVQYNSHNISQALTEDKANWRDISFTQLFSPQELAVKKVE